MVITRSQSDAAEMEERRHDEEAAPRRGTERRRIEIEERGMSSDPQTLSTITRTTNAAAAAAAAGVAAATAANAATTAIIGMSSRSPDRRRAASPVRSTRSHRSTASVQTRLRLAELEAAEKLASIRRRELEIESDLIKKRLAVEVSVIHEESLHEEPLPPADDHRKVDDWLRSNPVDTRGEEAGAGEQAQREPRQLRFEERRRRSLTPTKTKNGIEQLAETLEKMARPRPRHIELPAFSGSPTEWLPFKAAVRDSTKLYSVSAAENLQRLRGCLKGEARDAVSALLHTATDPDTIMKTLEQCFGRPELIIDRALEELKRLPKPGASATDLNSFAIKLQNVTCVLKTIDRRGYLYNPMLAREVLEKLSPHIRSRWCDYADDHEGTADPEIVVLSRFLMREADRALKYTYAPNTSAATAATAKQTVKPAIGPKKKAVYAVAESTEEQAEPCPSCEQAHALTKCPTYKALSVDKRWDFVREKKLCFKCIRNKHRRLNCKAKLCDINQCRRPHHPTLHQDRSEQTTPKPTTQEPPSSDEAVLSVATLNATGPRSVLLKMCPVVVVGPRGEVNTFALLDEGATITLIDEELARSVGAEGPSKPLHLHGVNMSQQERDSKVVNVRLRGKEDCELRPLRARTIRNLKLHQQSIPVTLLEHDHLRDLLESEVCYDMAQPGILVGTDHWEYIVSRELRTGGANEPAASRTQLGWVVHGTVPRSAIYSDESVLHIFTPDRRVEEKSIEDQQLHELVEAHFRIDALGVAYKTRVSDADLRAVKIAEQTLRKIDVGYEVGLPWSVDNTATPPSYAMALRRLRKLEQKMDRSPDFAAEYTAQVENLLQKGYAVPCDGTETTSAICWYLPHFAVQNPNKPGKRRLVFDAAARSHGVSLNDMLLEGPDLLLSLQGIVFRFREKPIAIAADIQEMFLRIKIRPEDQPAQQFLWRGSDRTQPPRHYKMTSMIFGAVSSPFMAHYVRDHNARAHAETHPYALEAITRAHYMDDLVASYEDEEQARRAIAEIREVHAAAGFTLRGWSASDKRVLNDVPTELHSTTTTRLGGEALITNKILGLFWNDEQDELGFNTTMNRVPAEVRAQTRAPTKREALSAVMSIYDPLGLLSQYTVRAKIILQILWRHKMSWDEPIPAEEEELFADWLRHLTEITRLRLDRCYKFEEQRHVELHVLCDASEQAYAAVAYWRICHEDGTVSVALVAAKAKVAPQRTQTIPRLELQAAVIGARLADTIKKEHRVSIARTIYWTDSTTVLHWIRDSTRKYTPFVAHRLSEIAELSQKEDWRWVPTSDNVADDATRFSRASITRSDRWFQGPSFLYAPEEQWPTENNASEKDEEEVMLHTTKEKAQRDSWLPEPARFSKYETLLRATALALAFVDVCRRRATKLECSHLERAEQALLRRAQEDSFGEEIMKLKSARPITKASRLFKLDPILEDGVLRVRGRIEAATAPIETKRPIILDGRHPLTKLIVLREHCAAGHANRERVTNDLRQRYWVIHLRPTVRAIERDCALCRVRRARPQVPATGDLPRARIDPFHRPFTNCGIDYFGPMMVKVGRRREKRWGALFTCLTSRAVHIELVASLSTDSAIMALRRMAARRGWPRIMYSDNATNFRGADKELRAAYAEWASSLRDIGLMHRMEWRYIPPGAPNQGGAWERLVRSIKTALSATLREKAPPEEVLKTLLTEAEFSVNARPLTHVSVSPHDPEALTPNHFLLGSSTGLPTTGSCEEADRRTWRASQALADHFWQRWVREYLPSLVPRGEPTGTTRKIQVGDIVIVVDTMLPRNVWPRGVVERTYEGPDGNVRVADIRTKTGTFKRPVRKLIVLVKEEAS